MERYQMNVIDADPKLLKKFLDVSMVNRSINAKLVGPCRSVSMVGADQDVLNVREMEFVSIKKGKSCAYFVEALRYACMAG